MEIIMIRLYVIAALILSSELQAVEDINSSSEENFTPNDLDIMIEKRCLRNANESSYNELWEAIFNFYTCMSENMHNIPRNETSDKIICTKIREGSYNCLKNLLEKVEPCLDFEEKFLLEFVLNVHNTSFEQECKEGVVSMNIRKSALNSAKCNPPVKDLQNKLVEVCFPKVDIIKKLHKFDYVLTKTDLCSDIETAKICTVNEAQKRCKNEESVVEFVSDYFDQYLYWCKVEPTTNLIS